MRRRLRVAALLCLATVAALAAQSDRPPAAGYRTDVEYDGRLTFVRLRWGGAGGFGRGFGAAWNHDLPRAEQHLGLIVRELTLANMREDGSRILSLDDPELFNYPIAFMWEPGFWNLTDVEALSFRSWLAKGGFAVFEDFDGADQWQHFASQMRRVLPGGRWVRLDGSHPIFDAFFRLQDIDAIVHPMTGIRPSYFGIFEDNDPTRRLMVIANFDNDVPEYWEWSGEGLYPFDASNEAYKLGVNYVIYGLTR